MKFLHQVAEEEKSKKIGKAEELLAKLERLCKEENGRWGIEDRMDEYSATCVFPFPKTVEIAIYNERGVGTRKSIQLSVSVLQPKEEEFKTYIEDFELPRRTVIFPPFDATFFSGYTQPKWFETVHSVELSKFNVVVDKNYSDMDLRINP